MSYIRYFFKESNEPTENDCAESSADADKSRGRYDDGSLGRQNLGVDFCCLSTQALNCIDHFSTP